MANIFFKRIAGQSSNILELKNNYSDRFLRQQLHLEVTFSDAFLS